MRKRCSILILIVALWTAALAQESSSRQTSTDQPAKGAIDGRVVNESGQALSGITIQVVAINRLAGLRFATTDMNGNFRVGNLESSLYSVTPFAPAYTLPSDPEARAHYRIGDSINFQMIRGGVITGTVSSSQGEPLVGVRVRVTMVRDQKGERPKAQFSFREQTTDDRGVYRIYGLALGTYVVSAGGQGSSPSFNQYESDVPTYAPSSTRDTAAEVLVHSGEEATADIRYRGEAGRTVSGKAIVSGSAGASVTITPAGTTMALMNTFQTPEGRGFVFNGLSDGDYDLVAMEMTSGASSVRPIMALSEPKRITVNGADVTGIELMPKLLGTVSGRVTFETLKLPDCQGKRPPLVEEMLVHLQRSEKELEKESNTYQPLFNASISPDAKGNFVVRNLRSGKYKLGTTFYARYWYLKSITSGGAKAPRFDAAANWTLVRSGEQLSNLVITLAEGAASIRGTVPVAEGASLPAGTTVHLIPGEPTKADDVLRYFVTNVAVDGTFAFNNVAPGKYLALLQTNADAQTTTQSKLREPDAAAARTKLRRTAETKKTEIELKPCQNFADYQLKQ